MDAFGRILMFFGQVYILACCSQTKIHRGLNFSLRASFHSLEVSKGISSIQIFFIGYEWPNIGGLFYTCNESR